MNSITRVTANIFFSIIISLVFADFAYFGHGFIKASPMNAAIVVFATCFASALLICELFSVSKESNKIKSKVKKTRLSKIAKRIALENAKYNRRIRNGEENQLNNKNKKSSDNGIKLDIKVNKVPASDDVKQDNLTKNESASVTEATSKDMGKKTSEQSHPDKSNEENNQELKEQQKESQINQQDLVNLYIGNLSYSIQEEEIKELLSKYGQIAKIHVLRNKKGKKKKAYAYVNISLIEAQKIVADLNNTNFQGRNLYLKITEQQNEN